MENTGLDLSKRMKHKHQIKSKFYTNQILTKMTYNKTCSGRHQVQSTNYKIINAPHNTHNKHTHTHTYNCILCGIVGASGVSLPTGVSDSVPKYTDVAEKEKAMRKHPLGQS